jgi:hypothetical protein
MTASTSTATVPATLTVAGHASGWLVLVNVARVGGITIGLPMGATGIRVG